MYNKCHPKMMSPLVKRAYHSGLKFQGLSRILFSNNNLATIKFLSLLLKELLIPNFHSRYSEGLLILFSHIRSFSTFMCFYAQCIIKSNFVCIVY